jgi:hypothetical protein
MMTPKGLMRCTVAEFKPAEYKGLNKNHSNSKKTALKPTNVGNPCKTK